MLIVLVFTKRWWRFYHRVIRPSPLSSSSPSPLPTTTTIHYQLSHIWVCENPDTSFTTRVFDSKLQSIRLSRSFPQDKKLKRYTYYTFTCKAEVVAAEREGAPPRRLQPQRQQHRTTGLTDREAVAAAVDYHRRLFLYLGLYHDPGPGPSPFRVNSAFPASLCCSWSFLERPVALEERYFQHPRLGTQRHLCRRSHPHHFESWTCPVDWPTRQLPADLTLVAHLNPVAPAKSYVTCLIV